MKNLHYILIVIIIVLIGFIIFLIRNNSTPKQLELIIPENPFAETSICRDCGNDNDDNLCSRFRVTTNLDLEDLHFGGPCFEKEFISENFKIVEFCVPSNGGYIEVSYPHCQPKKILFKEVIRGVVYTINIECVEKKIEIKEDKIKEKQDEIITEEPKPEFNYLTFTAQEPNSSVGIENVNNNPDIEFSKDGGNSWQKFPRYGGVELRNIGDKMFVRGSNPEGFSKDGSGTSFIMSGKIAASGSVMSLIDGKGKTLIIPNANCFSGLFVSCTSLTTTPELPATTLAENCYSFMFSGCTSLTTAPELPASTLAVNCYIFMFYDCTSLTTAPELPATTLAEQCYWCMFHGCTSLTTVPELPATTLKESCYMDMFSGCKSLTTAPKLPATNLKETCYWGMFDDCKSLTIAPELPATNLAADCYRYMFLGCKNLKSMKVRFDDWKYDSNLIDEGNTDHNPTVDWLKGVASSGTFYCPRALKKEFGRSHIPEGWEVRYID